MNAVASFSGHMKAHVLGQTLIRRNSYYDDRSSNVERTPRGKTPLIVHRPPVHDALRRHGVEPLFTR